MSTSRTALVALAVVVFMLAGAQAIRQDPVANAARPDVLDIGNVHLDHMTKTLRDDKGRHLLQLTFDPATCTLTVASTAECVNGYIACCNGVSCTANYDASGGVCPADAFLGCC